MSCAVGFYSTGCPKGSVRNAACLPCSPALFAGPIVWNKCDYRCADGFWLSNGTVCTNATIPMTPTPPPPLPPLPNTMFILSIVIGLQIAFLGLPGIAVLASAFILVFQPTLLIGKTMIVKELTKIV